MKKLVFIGLILMISAGGNISIYAQELETIQTESKQLSKRELEKLKKQLTTTEKTVIWSIVLFSIFLLITRYRYKRKCDGCKKWNAMRKTQREYIGEKPTTIVEERTKKNSKGEVISSWEVDVPATIYYYHTHRKCKHCGYRDYLSSSETRKN
ncbi:MAG: hypothetical protein LBB15_00095 [Puniceicoccales bacterium]|jgi:hypothetical protein|nr:hypothetical protein [Puniceicoccales bacterium]